MNNLVAFGLACLVLAFLLGDALLFHGQGGLFVASKTVDLVEWVAFWR